MRITFRHMSASAYVDHVEPNLAFLSTLISEQRSRGHATGLLNEITAYADEKGVRLLLTVQAFGPPDALNNKQLEAFYGRFGFKRQPEFKYPPFRMYREPSQEIHGP